MEISILKFRAHTHTHERKREKLETSLDISGSSEGIIYKKKKNVEKNVSSRL